MRVLWGLRMSLVEKLSVGVVFAVGLITMVTAIIRSVTLESSSTSGQVSTTWLIMVSAAVSSVAQFSLVPVFNSLFFPLLGDKLNLG